MRLRILEFPASLLGKSSDGTTVEPGAIKSVIRKMLGGRQSLTYKHRAAVQGLCWPLIVWIDRGKRRHLFLRNRYRRLEYEPPNAFGARRSRQRTGESEIPTVSRQQVRDIDLQVIVRILWTGRLRRKTPQRFNKGICRTLFQQHGYHGQIPVGI